MIQQHNLSFSRKDLNHMCSELKAKEFHDSIVNILTSSIIGRSSWYLKDKFISVWAKHLQQQYILAKQPKVTSILMDTSLSEDEEIFVQPITYGNIKVLIHFNISILKQLVIANRKQKNVLQLADVISENGLIQYTETIYIPTLAFNNDPIMIVPYSSGIKDWLVADGNKRLTARIKSKGSSISAYLFIPDEASQSLRNCFEVSFYVFMAQFTLAQKCCCINEFTEIDNYFLKTLHRLSF